MQSEVCRKLKFNKKQQITRAEALAIALKIAKGRSLKDVAKELRRDYGPLNQQMCIHGLGVQQIKKLCKRYGNPFHMEPNSF